MLTPRIKTPRGMGKEHPQEFRIWNAMMHRCYNPKTDSYAHYGARGILICKRWHAFANFIKDMGSRPTPEHSIDRRDNEKGYSKKNCRWATHAEQHANRRNSFFIEYEGKICSAMDVAKQSKLPTLLVYRRLYASAMSLEDALTRPHARQPANKD